MTSIQITREVVYKNQKVIQVRMTNTSGAYVELTNYGASIVSIVIPNKNGMLGNVVLNYDKLEEYFSDTFYLGASVGRYANRISNAHFMLNEKRYEVDKNDGKNSNHGGASGFNQKVFDCVINSDNVEFTIYSADREGGFPGNLQLNITYRFSEENKLSIEYKSIADEYTPVSFTNHSYFNLATDRKDIWEHYLQVNSSLYLEMDDDFLPTGEILNVHHTAFDFQTSKNIKQNALLKNNNLNGYNNFFVKGEADHMPLVSMGELESGRTVDVYSSMSGVQIYTGDFLSLPFIPFGGICLEAQFHPDGVNHSHFTNCVLLPNKERIDIIEYHFGILCDDYSKSNIKCRSL